MNKSNIVNYSLLAIPLAFVGLPIYVNITDFYARDFKIDLSVIAILLIIVRSIDIVQDPLIGYFSDYCLKRKISHKKIIVISSIFLAISFFLLFNPPRHLNKEIITIWFLVFLVLTYSFFNFALINFESIAILLAKDKQQRIRINSAKEFCGLIGILLASALPSIISNSISSQQNSYFFLALTFVVMLIFIILFFFRKIKVKEKIVEHHFDFKKIIKEIWQYKIFCKFILVFFINSIAVSVPASTVIFFIKDILHQENKIGLFLIIYFLSAGLFIFMWRNLACKYGKIKIWIISIIGSILTFCGAYFVGESNYYLFYLICFLSGMFLGADLIMPPAIIADLIFDKEDKISTFVSLWNMVNKTALMLASSISLFILDFYSYQPGFVNNDTNFVLPAVYALIPCIIKFLVIILLLKFSSKNKYL